MTSGLMRRSSSWPAAPPPEVASIRTALGSEWLVFRRLPIATVDHRGLPLVPPASPAIVSGGQMGSEQTSGASPASAQSSPYRGRVSDHRSRHARSRRSSRAGLHLRAERAANVILAPVCAVTGGLRVD